MDFEIPIDTNVRAVQEREVAEQTRRVVVVSRLYPVAVARLWDTVTDTARIEHWFAPVSGDFREGGRFQIEGNASGTITHCNAPDALDLTWEISGDVSWVTVRLVGEGDGASLVLEHSMLKGGAGEDHWQRYGPGATGLGWEMALMGLGQYLESGGKPVDKEAFFAWMGSAAGQDFWGRCAAAWGDAHIAAGEAEDSARAAATATAAFYSGG